ncbi:hypothetical protein METH109765_10050 [Mesobacillus thioparans]
MEVSDQKVHLTCAEISNLWDTYVNDSVVKCILTHSMCGGCRGKTTFGIYDRSSGFSSGEY